MCVLTGRIKRILSDLSYFMEKYFVQSTKEVKQHISFASV